MLLKRHLKKTLLGIKTVSHQGFLLLLYIYKDVFICVASSKPDAKR